MTPGQAFIEACKESAAYHEAGHEVVCIAQGIPIQELGVHVDSKMNGVSLTFLRNPGDMSNTPADIAERGKSIVLLNAGYIAQKRFLPDILPESGEHDQKIVNALLGEMHPCGSQAEADNRTRLWNESRQLVEQYWAAIQALAQTLWAKPWESRVALPAGSISWSTDTREKWLHAEEVREVVRPFGLEADIRALDGGP